MADPRISKNAAHWRDRQQGLVPDDWPLTYFFEAPNLLTADGEDHARLRDPVRRAFTSGRVKALGPRIATIADDLLDGMDARGTVDLKAAFSLPLPLTVISELLGVPEDPAMREQLHQLSMSVVASTATTEQVRQTRQEFPTLLQRLVDVKRALPGDDLTSDLVTACDGGQLTDDEVIATMLLTVIGGHETTVNLLNAAVRALLTHPDQLRLLRDGEATWGQAIQETLRWDPPIRFSMPRFTTEPYELDGTVIPQGALVAIPITTVGRCPHAHADPDTFDIRRADRNLAFGHGAHRCPGAPLALAEAEIALPKLFARFPEIVLTHDQPSHRMPSLGVNSIPALYVNLRPTG